MACESITTVNSTYSTVCIEKGECIFTRVYGSDYRTTNYASIGACACACVCVCVCVDCYSCSMINKVHFMISWILICGFAKYCLVLLVLLNVLGMPLQPFQKKSA